MTEQLRHTLTRFIQALRVEQIPVERLFLFGSVARGTQHAWSDLEPSPLFSQLADTQTLERPALAELNQPLHRFPGVQPRGSPDAHARKFRLCPPLADRGFQPGWIDWLIS